MAAPEVTVDSKDMAMHLDTSRRSPRTAQTGSVLFVVLIALLLMFLGALFTFRGALTDTSLTDAFSQRQKNTQASDLALQWVVAQITQTTQANPGQLLESAASGKSWFLSLAPGTALTQPSPSYWATCIAKSTSTDTCAPVTLSNGTAGLANGATQSAWAFVESTGQSDATACGDTQGLVARYYDIWVHTVDTRTGVAVDTEALYKLCLVQ